MVLKDVECVENIVPGAVRQDERVIHQLLNWDSVRHGVEHVSGLGEGGGGDSEGAGVEV